MASENTQRKQSGLIPYQPGQSGNPNGRPKGSRNKLGEAFTEALHADFNENGIAAIQKMRAEDVSGYVRVIAGLLPKEMKIESAPLSDLSDDELSRLIDIIRTATSGSDPAGARAGKAEKGKQAPGIQTLQ
jgi:Family of unknown function (DUF5681)